MVEVYHLPLHAIVRQLQQEMYPEQHQETDFIDDESDDDDI